MMPSLLKGLLKIITWTLFILFFFIVILGLFMATDAGTKLVSNVAQGISPNLHIQGLQGSAIRDLHIEQVDWTDAKQKVTVKNLQLKSQLSDVFGGRLHIETASADSVDISLSETNEEKTKPTVIALPVNIQIDRLRLKTLRIHKADTVQEIRDIQLTASTENNQLLISAFKAQPIVDGEPIDLKLTAQADLNAPHQLSSDLTLAYTHDIHGKAKGQFTLEGDMDAYMLKGKADLISTHYGNGQFDVLAIGSDHGATIKTFTLDALQGMVNATGKVDWQDEITWQFDLQADDINTKRIFPNWPMSLSTRFKTQGSLKDEKTKGEIVLESLQGDIKGSPLLAKGKIQLEGNRAYIEYLNIKALEGVAETSGEITWGDKLAWDVKLNADKLNTKAILPDWPATLSTQLNTKGTLENDTLKGEVDLQKLDGKFQAYPLSAVGKIKLNKQTAEIVTLQLKALGGSVDGTGSVTWGDAPSWDLALDSKGIETKKLFADWPAIITAKLTTKGMQKNNKTDATIDLQSLNGKLQGYKLTGKGKIEIKANVIRVNDLQINSGQNTLYANGQASEPFNLEWKLKGDKLRQLHKNLRGNINATGQLKGTVEKPQLQAKLKGKNLRYQNYQLAAVKLDVRQSNQNYQIEGEVDKLTFAQQTIKKLDIAADGTLENHNINLNLRHSDADIALKAKGGWQSEQWKGSLQNLQLDKTAAGDWTLTNPVAIMASQQAFSSGKLCLKNSSALICSKNKWQAASGLIADGTLQNVPLNLLKTWLPPTISLAGKANADFNIKPSAGVLKLRLPDSSISIRLDSGKTQQLQYTNTKVDANLAGNTLKSNFTATIKDRGDVSGQATISLADDMGKSGINGNVKIDMPDIAWVNSFVPDIQKLKGRINSQLSLSGTIDQPQINGKTSLVNGSFALLETGTNIQNINITINSQGTRQSTIAGSLQSGKGRMDITGNIALGNGEAWKANVRLKGSNLDFMNTYEIKGVVSPDLTIVASPETVNITGTLTIPETRITLNELPPAAIHASDDVVIVGQSKAKKRHTMGINKKGELVINPNVTIVLGDKVSFSGFGLKTNLAGKFLIREQQKELFAEGNVKIVNGSYEAYGQVLKINQGSLIFNGPIDDPNMDIKAIRKLSDVEVGIHLTGTVQKPETTLFSTPTQSQSNTLSYLLTGKKLSDASGEQSSMLLSAITGLGVSGGEGIARNIGTSLGLDSVNINADNGLESSELELGKRLGPKLYLKYIVGLFDALQHIAIEYRINKRLIVEAQSGENQGFDLIYQMER